MIIDTKWKVLTTGGSEDFTFTAASAQTSAPFDLKAAGYADGGSKLFLHVTRKYGATYTKNALSNFNIAIYHAAARSGDSLTSGVSAISVDVPVATIDAGYELAKIPLPPVLKQNIAVVFTPTGAPTTVTLNARIVTS